MRLEFGNLEHILHVKKLRIDAISQEIEEIDEEWLSGGHKGKGVLNEMRQELLSERAQLTMEYLNIHDEQNHNFVPLNTPTFVECESYDISFPDFKSDFWYP